MCSIGVYSLSNSTDEVMLCALIGLVGYLLYKFRFEPAPLLLGFVLGGMVEENLRRALIIARGDLTVFVREPISLVLLLATAVLLITIALPKLRSQRDEVFSESEE
jgi:putative tricarboxylic transport membrane protein